uniref:Dynactin subunit 1 n=1 Tax=Parastrongyloides trichosuri TaxID=131310 RepID=A0A0N4ZP11_PARTI
MDNFKKGDKVDTDKGKGTVAYFGETKFKDGIWVGIILEKRNGKNNGTINGVTYFNCDEDYGIFMKPSQVRREGERRMSTRPSVVSSARGSKVPSAKQSMRNSPVQTPRSMSPSKSSVNLQNLNQGSRKTSINSSDVKSPRDTSKVSGNNKTNNDSLQSSGQSAESFEMVKEETISEIKDNVDDSKSPSVIDELEKPVEISPTKYVPPPNMDEGEELEYLRMQKVELEGKIETLKEKIRDYKPKVDELKRAKLTIEGLEENKKRILEQNTRLKKDVEEYKNKYEETLNKFNEIETPDVIELKAQIEELTIDKEIAEEKCETIEADLELCKSQYAEKEKELAILKSEMERADPNTGGNSLQFAALQRQNDNLSEVIHKLRDHIAQSKILESENKKVIDQLKQDLDDYEDLTDKQEAEIAELKNTLSDYSEQIDAAAGSEKVIDSLTEKNLELEDKVSILNEQIVELEELNDMNEQLLLCAKEDEDEYKKQLDEKFAELNVLRKALKLREEEIDKFETTIQQFRSRIVDLNSEIQNKEDEILIEREKLEKKEENGGAPVAGSNRVFAEIVDLELYKINSEYSQMTSKLLKFFLPDNFSKAGGDNDALLLTVALPRVVSKADVLGDLLYKKFPPVPGGMRRQHVTKSHRGEQWGFVANVGYILAQLKVVAKKFESTLQSCSVDKLASICHLQQEFAHHEKTLDSYFELLKQDRFDENSNIDSLSLIVHHFNHSFNINMSMESYDNKEMLINTISQLTKGFSWININSQRILYYLKDDDYSKEHELIKNFNKIIETLSEGEKLLIRTNNHIPKEKDILVNSDFMDSIDNVITSLEKIAKIFVQTCKAATSMMNLLTNCDDLSIKQLTECIQSSVEKLAGTISIEKALEFIQNYANKVKNGLENIANIMEKDSLVVDNVERKLYSALHDRALSRKKDSQELESLRWQVSTKDDKILELNKALKEKKDCIRNLELKLETHMKNSDGGRGSDKRVERFRQEYNERISEYKMKEEALVEEIRLLKEQIDIVSNEKVVHTGQLNDSQLSFDMSLKNMGDHVQSKDLVAQFDILKKNYQRLQDSYIYTAYKSCTLQAREDNKILSELKPLKEANSVAGIYSLQSYNKSKQREELLSLSHEADRLNNEWTLLQLEGINPSNKRQHILKVNAYNNKVQELEFKFFNYWSTNHPGKNIPQTYKRPKKIQNSNDKSFTTNESSNLLKKWINISNSVKVQ